LLTELSLRCYTVLMRSVFLSALCALLAFGCASAHERKIRQLYDAAKADNFTAFAPMAELQPAETQKLFETFRAISREKNTIRVTEPGLKHLPDFAGASFCAHAVFYYDSFWDFRLIKLPDTSHYYFIFRYDDTRHQKLTNVVWGGQSGLGVALAGLASHSSRSQGRIATVDEACRALNGGGADTPKH
jgi:hypothetical protein